MATAKSASSEPSANAGLDRWLLRTIGLLCILGAVMANHYFPGWGRTILVTTFVFIGLTVMWRRYWKQWWFWGTILSLLIVHIILLPEIRTLLNGQNILGSFLVAAGEAVLISAILSLPMGLFSKKER